MEISYRTRKLQKQCTKKKEAEKHLGNECAAKLMLRLDDLRAAECLADISHLPPARLHELTGADNEVFSVDLAHPFRLLFVPDEDPVPMSDDGGIDRSSIRTIKIIDIRDTH